MLSAPRKNLRFRDEIFQYWFLIFFVNASQMKYLKVLSEPFKNLTFFQVKYLNGNFWFFFVNASYMKYLWVLSAHFIKCTFSLKFKRELYVNKHFILNTFLAVLFDGDFSLNYFSSTRLGFIAIRFTGIFLWNVNIRD